MQNYEPNQAAFFNKSTFDVDRQNNERENLGFDSVRMTPSELLQTDKENSMIGSIKASTRVDHRSINNNTSENKMSKRDIFIEENDVSNQNTQRETSRQSNFDRSKSSRVA